MNPYGLVAAAVITSMTSTSSSRAESENSLASAMLTARNVFSTSLVISAASGEDTVCIALAVCRNSSAAREVHAAVTPPTTRGVRSGAWASTPGSMRSGLNATNTSRPTSRPLSCNGFTMSSRVHPIYVVDVSTIVCPAVALATTSAQAADSALRSGDWWASMGVGTHTTIASARDNAVGSVVSRNESFRRWRARRWRSRVQQVNSSGLDIG